MPTRKTLTAIVCAVIAIFSFIFIFSSHVNSAEYKIAKFKKESEKMTCANVEVLEDVKTKAKDAIKNSDVMPEEYKSFIDCRIYSIKLSGVGNYELNFVLLYSDGTTLSIPIMIPNAEITAGILTGARFLSIGDSSFAVPPMTLVKSDTYSSGYLLK